MCKFKLSAALAVVLLAGSSLTAQTVQLPTQTVFSVGTTVSVPDRGRSYLGGVRRLSEGSTSRGIPILGQLPGIGRLFKNRGIGRDASDRSASVNAYIISLEEQEEALLSKASRRISAGDPQVARKAGFLSRNVVRHSRPPTRGYGTKRSFAERSSKRKLRSRAQPTVADIRRQNEAAQEKQSADALKYFAQGQKAEAEGKAGVAKIFYRMAAKRSQGTALQEQIAERLKVVSAPKSQLVGK